MPSMDASANKEFDVADPVSKHSSHHVLNLGTLKARGETSGSDPNVVATFGCDGARPDEHIVVSNRQPITLVVQL